MRGGTTKARVWWRPLFLLAVALLALAPGAGSAAGVYMVRPGDTLGAVARDVGVPLEALAAANGLHDPDLVLAGAALAIPATSPGQAAGEYVVRPGDTVWGIAGARATTPAALVALNPALADPDRLAVGQVLRVPAAVAAAPGGATVRELEGALRDLVAAHAARGGTRAGLLVKDGCSGEAVRIAPDAPFRAASLFKLFVLWATQVAIAAGTLADDTALTLTAATDAAAEDGYALGPYGSTLTVAEARRLMIASSSNTAALLLLEATGGWGALQRLLDAHGFAATRVVGVATTTPREVTRFFEAVVDRALDPRLAGADYALMLDLLRAGEVNAFLAPGLPPGIPFAHKGGNLAGVQHDAGVALPPGGCPLYVTVLTAGDYEAGVELIRSVARLVAPVLATSPSGSSLARSRPRR